MKHALALCLGCSVTPATPPAVGPVAATGTCNVGDVTTDASDASVETAGFDGGPTLRGKCTWGTVDRPL